MPTVSVDHVVAEGFLIVDEGPNGRRLLKIKGYGERKHSTQIDVGLASSVFKAISSLFGGVQKPGCSQLTRVDGVNRLIVRLYGMTQPVVPWSVTNSDTSLSKSIQKWTKSIDSHVHCPSSSSAPGPSDRGATSSSRGPTAPTRLWTRRISL